ncbi:DNA-binding MarR family transcriptional regulator [Elusimicrobium posterum]|uniref:MarR family winged helix-turn-helix transcriptional regulator n=1 Tax=Elusimicrobium posterum TaxID=3116653 RepID=UPI003C7470A0
MTEKEITIMEKFARVNALMHRMHHHMHMEDGVFTNVHRGQGRVLAILQMKPNMSQKDLGYLLDMRAQSLSELLLKLERNGYIKRTESEEDRRSMNISLTPEGEEAASKSGESSKEEFFSFLVHEEREVLSELLDKIITNLQEKTGGMDERRGGCGHHHGPHGHPFGPGHGPFGHGRRGGFGRHGRGGPHAHNFGPHSHEEMHEHFKEEEQEQED